MGCQRNARVISLELVVRAQVPEAASRVDEGAGIAGHVRAVAGHGRERRVLPRAVRLTYLDDQGKPVRWIFPVMMTVLAP